MRASNSQLIIIQIDKCELTAVIKTMECRTLFYMCPRFACNLTAYLYTHSYTTKLQRKTQPPLYFLHTFIPTYLSEFNRFDIIKGCQGVDGIQICRYTYTCVYVCISTRNGTPRRLQILQWINKKLLDFTVNVNFN